MLPRTRLLGTDARTLLRISEVISSESSGVSESSSGLSVGSSGVVGVWLESWFFRRTISESLSEFWMPKKTLVPMPARVRTERMRTTGRSLFLGLLILDFMMGEVIGAGAVSGAVGVSEGAEADGVSGVVGSDGAVDVDSGAVELLVGSVVVV